jgi:hypothetical protein
MEGSPYWRLRQHPTGYNTDFGNTQRTKIRSTKITTNKIRYGKYLREVVYDSTAPEVEVA